MTRGYELWTINETYRISSESKDLAKNAKPLPRLNFFQFQSLFQGECNAHWRSAVGSALPMYTRCTGDERAMD